jgi:type IV secretion system protein VirB4
MRQYIAILSGRANTVKFAASLRKIHGDIPGKWLPEFMARYQEATD